MICRVLIKSMEKPDTIHDFKEHKLLTINVLIIVKDQLINKAMKRFLKIPILVLLVLMINPVFSQRLKGNVKSYKDTYYSIREIYGKIKKGPKLSDTAFRDQEVSFDQKGNITESVEYNLDGTESCKFKGSTDYEDNNIESIYVRFDPEVKVDKKPFLISSVRYSSGEMCEMSYKNDTMGRPVEETIFDLMGRVIYTITFKRDEKGKLLEYDYSDGTKDRYKYDNKGNKIEWTFLSASGKPSITSYDFDESGNITEINVNNYFKSTFNFQYDTYKFKYLYDSHGNWVERIEYSGEQPKRMKLRTIEYGS